MTTQTIKRLKLLWRLKFSSLSAVLLACFLVFSFIIFEPSYFLDWMCSYDDFPPHNGLCKLKETPTGIKFEITTHGFAMAVSAYCLVLSTLILIISLPIYLFSKDEMRAEKAGRLTKTTLGFVIAAGTGVIGTLSFVA